MKPNHYTIVMGDINAQIGKRTNPMETATGKFGLGLRNERGDTLVELETSRKYKNMNTMFQKKAGRGWAWKSPNGVMKTEIDYILTNRPDIVTDLTVINQVNVKLDIEVERNTIDDQEATNIRCHTNTIKEDRIPTRIEKSVLDTTRTR